MTTSDLNLDLDTRGDAVLDKLLLWSGTDSEWIPANVVSFALTREAPELGCSPGDGYQLLVGLGQVLCCTDTMVVYSFPLSRLPGYARKSPDRYICCIESMSMMAVIINYSVTTLAPIVVIEVDQSSQCFLFLKDNLNR